MQSITVEWRDMMISHLCPVNLQKIPDQKRSSSKGWQAAGIWSGAASETSVFKHKALQRFIF